MILDLDRERFTAAVIFAARALPRSAVHPALAGVRITAGPGGVLVAGFDYDTYAEANAGPSTETVDLLLPGRALASYLSGMTSPTVTLDIEDNGVKVSSGAAKVTLRTLNLADYPSAPALPASVGTVDAGALAAAFTHVKDAIDTEKTDAALTGIRVVALDGALSVVGASRYRLVARDLSWSGGPDFDVLLPVTMTDVARSLLDDVVLGVGDMVSLGDADRCVMTRTIAGEPPRWRALLATPEPSLTVTVARAGLIDALKFVTLGSKRDEAMCTIATGTDVLSVALSGADAHDAATEVEAKVDGDASSIRYKPVYLLDALAGTDAETVTFAFTSPNRVSKLTAESDSAYSALCMPVKS